MNNSKIAIDSLIEEDPPDTSPLLRERENELIAVIEALEHITGSNYWKVLEDRMFNPELEKLKNDLSSEKEPIEIYRLQGQIKKAKKLDLAKQLITYRDELLRIRNKLNA